MSVLKAWVKFEAIKKPIAYFEMGRAIREVWAFP